MSKDEKKDPVPSVDVRRLERLLRRQGASDEEVEAVKKALAK